MLYNIGKPFTYVYYKLIFRAKIEGHENIPKQGPVILCSNHRSKNDPLLLGTFVRRQIHFMAKAELFKYPGVRHVMRAIGAFPVDRDAPDVASFREGMKILEDGRVLCVFPQGRRFDEIRPEDAKPGVALFALKSDAVVIPVKIAPGYKPFRKIRIKVGKPVDLSAFKGTKPRQQTLKEAVCVIMKGIIDL